MASRITSAGARAAGSRGPGIVAVIVAVATMSACSAQPYPEIPRDAALGGQTQDELTETLSALDGLTVVEAAGSEPNVKGNTGYSFDLQLDRGFRITDPAALLNFLVESAWSVRNGYMPNTSIEISLIGDPSDPVDLALVGKESGWVPASRNTRGVAENGYTSVSVFVDTGTDFAERNGGADNRDRLGGWPGAAPPVPADMIVPVTAGQ